MTVVDQAENIGGIVSAARQRERWQQQMAKTSDDERREAFRDAIGTLEMRFPELEDVGPGGAERFARERGHGTGARSPSHEGRARHRATRKPDAAPLERAAAKAGTPPKARKSSPAAPAGKRPRATRGGGGRRTFERRASARGRRAYRETGIPAAGASGSRIAMSALGATVGLAAFYLVLTSAERQGGAKQIIGLLDTVTGFLRRIIGPVDFFGHSLTHGEYAAAIAPGSPAALQSALPKLPHLAHPTPGGKSLHVKPAELGFGHKHATQRR